MLRATMMLLSFQNCSFLEFLTCSFSSYTTAPKPKHLLVPRIYEPEPRTEPSSLGTSIDDTFAVLKPVDFTFCSV